MNNEMFMNGRKYRFIGTVAGPKGTEDPSAANRHFHQIVERDLAKGPSVSANHLGSQQSEFADVRLIQSLIDADMARLPRESELLNIRKQDLIKAGGADPDPPKKEN